MSFCLCSTKLDRNHTEEYLQREKRAELLASQIESQDKVCVCVRVCVCVHVCVCDVTYTYTVTT